MSIHKNEYLQSKDVDLFVGFLAAQLSKDSFSQPLTFSVRDTSVYPGYPHFKTNASGGRTLTISSLKEAFDRYWWDGGDFAANDLKLLAVQKTLQAAMALPVDSERSNAACLAAVSDVLEWGAGGTGLRLYTANMAWAQSNLDTLAQRLALGKQTMESAFPNVDVFKHVDGPRMNAGYTKVYALGCEDSIIYDGRVGAALGLLVRMHCAGLGLGAVPDLLGFRWSAQTSSGNTEPLPRDPSTGAYRFAQLRNDSRSWATWNLRANWILKAARDRLQPGAWCAGADGSRRIEAALFTMGYHIPRHPTNPSGVRP